MPAPPSEYQSLRTCAPSSLSSAHDNPVLVIISNADYQLVSFPNCDLIVTSITMGWLGNLTRNQPDHYNAADV